MTKKTFTNYQQTLVDELVQMHGLDPSQISFEGDDNTPIFDYEAVCALSLKLTNIEKIKVEISDRDLENQYITASCTVTLPDGKIRSSEDSAHVGEEFGLNSRIDSIRLAENVAQARAVRRGIRSVGINLFRAHQLYKANGGSVVEAHTNNDPRNPQYQEIHKLAAKIGYINGSDKSEYEKYIGEMFDGRSSSKDLDDLELQKLIVGLRALARLQDATESANQHKAA